MFKIKNGRLDRASVLQLAKFQTPIDQEVLYPDKVVRAISEWTSKRSDKVFEKVRSKLIEMCPTGDYCYYCCGSEAGVIDHFQPKTLYPKLTFAWPNFIHACERCNTKHKRDHCAVVISGSQPRLIDVTRPPKAPVLPPKSGRIALINPRREDPMDFLRLDVLGTFEFQSRHAINTTKGLRATYTIDLLSLNRPYLIRERRGAYEAIVRFLKSYYDTSQVRDNKEMRRMRRNIRSVSHQAVWQELVRSHARVPEVSWIFAACPELLRLEL